MDNINNKTLFKLIKEGKHKEFEKILENRSGIDLNIRDNLDNYLITYTVIQNNYNIVKKLLDRGCRIDIVDNEGRSLLFYAVRYGYHKILKLILEYDKQAVGVSIVDLKDKQGMIPLHYAAIYKDIEAINILIEYDSNPSIVDNNGSNALHHAIYNQSIEACDEILKTNIDINARTSTGENALHLAINFNMTQVAKKLIDMGIDVNAKDFNHEFTALHYTVTVNNIKIFKLLLNTDINLNQQDHLGYTTFHYICAMNQEMFFDILLKSNRIDQLNVNIYNYENRIPIMMYLNNGSINSKHIEYLILNSNLNMQNFEGFSALHLLIKKGLWKKYKDILTTKKLNIFLKNSDGDRPIDLVKNDEIDDFMNIVVDSYLYILRTYSGKWKEEWENICKDTTFDKQTLNKLQDITKMKEKDSVNICRQIIKEKLYKLKDSKVIPCGSSSYPLKENSRCLKIDIKQKETVNVCTFTGAVLDVLFGLVYLLKKNKNSCTPIDSKVDTELSNFEILWVRDVLKVNNNIVNLFKSCLSKKKRFVLIPLGIELDQASHANYIVYDSKVKEFERFEPYGSHGPYQFNYNSRMLDFSLKKLFLQLDSEAKYVKPIDFLPKVGFQFFETVEAQTSKIGDPTGFCALWSIWYADQRLSYPDIKRESLVKKLIKQIRLQDMSYKNLIRNYSINITAIRDNIFEKANMTINDWINDSYTPDDLKMLVSEIDKIVLKYNT